MERRVRIRWIKRNIQVKVVHIPRRFTRNAWGGTETYILEIAKRLPNYGIESEIICPCALDQPGEELIDGVRVQRFPYFYPYLGLDRKSKAKLDQKGGNLFSFQILKTLKSRKELDLIHLHTAKRLGSIGRHVAKIRGIPYVVTLHGGVAAIPDSEQKTYTEPTRGAWEWGRALGYWFGSRSVLADADTIMCVDRQEVDILPNDPTIAAAIAGHGKPYIRYRPGGVDVQRFGAGIGQRFRSRYGIVDDEPLILNVGRIDSQKNQLFAVEMLHRLRLQNNRGKLVLIGPTTNGDYQEQLLQKINETGLGDHVILTGGIAPDDETLVDAYAAADCFLLCSKHEPFGLVVLEAWSARVPVVLASHGGPLGFTNHGVDSLHYEPTDIDACVACVNELLNDTDKRQRITETAFKTAQTQFDWNRIAEEIATVYKQLAGICI